MNEHETHQEKIRVLQARAAALAVEPAPARAEESLLRVIEFRLADERYALEAKYVTEVYPLEDLTPLPGTPAFVLGLVNVRGRIIPVINLKVFFELPEKGITDFHRILLVDVADMEFGILADTVDTLRMIPHDSIEPSLPTLTGIRAEYIRGVTDGPLVILDLARIAASGRIVVHEEVEP